MNIGNSISPQAAASAYSNLMNVGTSAPAANTGKDEVSSFAEMMKENTVKSIETIKTGEQTSAKAVAGTADLTDVVQAVTAAELTLQSVVALRDRMIGAYQEIMRMPI
jgi:flagellar hook-basal body complex protein FliE